MSIAVFGAGGGAAGVTYPDLTVAPLDEVEVPRRHRAAVGVREA
ncbi:hypothetical protein [Streptosporangium sp. NPDC048865]